MAELRRGPDTQEFALQKQIFDLRNEAAKLTAELEAARKAYLGIVDLPKLPELKGRLSTPLLDLTPGAQRQAPGGAIPTPKAIEDAKKALQEIPPVPRLIAEEFDNAARFAKGFRSEVETIGDAFERFGQNVSRSFRSVSDLFNNLKNAVKNFFLDIVGNGLQNLVRGAFSSLGGVFGGGGTSGGGGGGIGGFFRSLASGFGGGFSTGPGGTATLTQRGALPFTGTGGPFGSIGAQAATIAQQLRGAPVSIGAGGGALGGSLGLSLLGAFGGASLGGGSITGSILGGLGGLTLGLGVGAVGAAGGFGALGLAGSLPILGPFAAIAAPLLIGAILLGRAKQRRKDEATSGDSLQNAINAIFALKTAAQANELTSVREAESAFKQIHSQFVSETQQLKTKSVRESRLAHQADITPPLHKDSIRLLFEREVLPAVEAAKKRGALFSTIVPEFAVGGFHLGVGFALLHDREMILNLRQQQRVQTIAGPDVFQRAGVPNAPTTQPAGTPAFANGGTFRAPPAVQAPVFIIENVTLAIAEGDATGIVEMAVRTPDGQRHVYNAAKQARRDRV